MKSIDVFSGCGGLSLGFEKSGFETVAAFDKNASACETFNKNIRNVCRQENLLKFTPKETKIEKENIKAVIGGPPCKDFSLCNYYSRGGEKTNLVFVFKDWVEHFQPDIFVMENVVGIKTSDKLSTLKREFESIGFNVTKNTLNAHNFCVPQKRNRFFLVGSKEGYIDLEMMKKPKCNNTVRDAFQDLPNLENGEASNKYNNHVAPDHTQDMVERIKNTERGDSVYDSWGERVRLQFDEPSPTLKAGKRANYHFAHPTDNRGLSIRERARLQTFPDNFVFEGSMTEMRKQTGNAVPFLLAKHISKYVLEQKHKQSGMFSY